MLRGSAVVRPLGLEDVLRGDRVALVIDPFAVRIAREADAQQQLFRSFGVKLVGVQRSLVLADTLVDIWMSSSDIQISTSVSAIPAM